MLSTDKTIFATRWIASWNSHDFEDILSHYSEDVEIHSPMIKLILGIDSGCLAGKTVVADYWRKALDKLPDLRFELIDVAEGVGSISLYYKSVMDKKTIEVMFFDEEGKVNKIFAHYTV